MSEASALEAPVLEVCALCRRRPARAGSAVCDGCWCELRAERPGRKPSAAYCPCGGGELHHLCLAPWDYQL